MKYLYLFRTERQKTFFKYNFSRIQSDTVFIMLTDSHKYYLQNNLFDSRNYYLPINSTLISIKLFISSLINKTTSSSLNTPPFQLITDLVSATDVAVFHFIVAAHSYGIKLIVFSHNPFTFSSSGFSWKCGWYIFPPFQNLIVNLARSLYILFVALIKYQITPTFLLPELFYFARPLIAFANRVVIFANSRDTKLNFLYRRISSVDVHYSKANYPPFTNQIPPLLGASSLPKQKRIFLLTTGAFASNGIFLYKQLRLINLFAHRFSTEYSLILVVKAKELSCLAQLKISCEIATYDQICYSQYDHFIIPLGSTAIPEIVQHSPSISTILYSIKHLVHPYIKIYSSVSICQSEQQHSVDSVTWSPIQSIFNNHTNLSVIYPDF